MQYLIPAMKNKEYITIIGSGAVINFIMNYILILKMGAMGAVIGTVVSEGIVCIWHLIDARKDLPVFSLVFSNWFYILDGIIMYIIVRRVASMQLISNSTLQVLCEVVLGGVIYMILCLVYWMITKKGLFYETLASKMKKL